MANAKQVQLRGGTLEEHREFVGAPREITINTDYNTIHVHDGITKGGHMICKKEDLDHGVNQLNRRIDEMQSNVGNSHNHDNLYSKLSHNHDSVYLKKVNGIHNVFSISKNGYFGLCDENKDDGGWYRTSKNGLLPYQSGGYSSIGASDWSFNEGHFNTLNAHTINIKKNGNYSKINFSAQTNDPGFIEHYENNNTSYLRLCVSDDAGADDEIQFGVTPGGSYQNNVSFRGDGSSWFRGVADFGGGYISINGKRIYIQSSQPSGARAGDVWFQV